MDHNSKSTNGQHLHESFDSTDEGLREAWSLFLARYRWHCFATMTFKTPRRDMFEIVNAFNIWLHKWHELEAVRHGAMTKKVIPREDAYGRSLPPRIKRNGSFWNQWRRGQYRPVYVLGIEPHQSGDLHMHAIIKFQTPWEMQRSTGWRVWSQPQDPNNKLPDLMDQGWSRIEPPKSQGDVASYCSKYVTKGGDLVLSRSFNARGVQTPFSSNAPEAA